MSADRKQRIENLTNATLAFYTKLGGGDPDDALVTLVDLLADLILVTGDDDFDSALETARMHAACESDPDGDEFDDDSHLAQYDDDPNPYHGTYSEE